MHAFVNKNVSFNYNSCLGCLSKPLSYRFASCFYSYINRLQKYSKCRCMIMVFFLLGVFDFFFFNNTVIFWSVTLLSGTVHSNTNSSHCKFGAWQNSEGADRTHAFWNGMKQSVFFFFNVYIVTLLTCPLNPNKNLYSFVHFLFFLVYWSFFPLWLHLSTYPPYSHCGSCKTTRG